VTRALDGASLSTEKSLDPDNVLIGPRKSSLTCSASSVSVTSCVRISICPHSDGIGQGGRRHHLRFGSGLTLHEIAQVVGKRKGATGGSSRMWVDQEIFITLNSEPGHGKDYFYEFEVTEFETAIDVPDSVRDRQRSRLQREREGRARRRPDPGCGHRLSASAERRYS
jgi:hypothetical protein